MELSDWRSETKMKLNGKHRMKALISVLMVLVVAGAGCRSREDSGSKEDTGFKQDNESREDSLTIDLGNRATMDFVFIPAGEFMMGSNEENRDTRPVHRVKISKGFYMAVTEVTQAQYKAIMGDYPNNSCFKGVDLPVQAVSWNDAVEFCRKLSEKEGKTYRLPTEAQWEYACCTGSA